MDLGRGQFIDGNEFKLVLAVDSTSARRMQQPMRPNH